jgi:hypothetical protein
VLATVRTGYGTGDERQEQANGNFRPGDIRLHAWVFLLIKLGSILAAMMVATMGACLMTPGFGRYAAAAFDFHATQRAYPKRYTVMRL